MRNAELDRATFEEIASDVFGTDMSGWTRVSTFDRESDAAGEVTRLVLAVDADGKPLPAAGDRPEGYTLGGVMIVSISHLEYGGVRPRVQINVWNPFNNRLLETGHSVPSVWEMDELTGGDPDWLRDPEIVERVLGEFETNLPDAIADALGQLVTDGRLPTAPDDPWADSLGQTAEPTADPWDESRGFDTVPPIREPPPGADDDRPDGYAEAKPWVPDDVHEAEPWDPSMHGSGGRSGPAAVADTPYVSGGVDWDTYEAYPGQNELYARLDGPREAPDESHPIDEIDVLPDATADGTAPADDDAVDWDSFETYRGERERYEQLDTEERLPPEESVPIEHIEQLGGDLPPETPPAPRDTTVRWAGASSGRIWTGSSVRVMFTDEHPPTDPSTGQPVAVISGTIVTSSGTTVPVPLFLLSHTRGGPAVYGSHLLTAEGTGVNHLPGGVGDSLSVTVGGRTDSITEVYDHPLEMTHAIQKDRLESAGFLIAEMRRQYVAATEGLEDDPTVKTNRQYFDESLRTIQLGIEHADDAENLKEKVASTQYFLDHTVLNARSMRDLAEGRIMWNPYHDDLRETTKLEHGLSMLSFYQNDVVIHEHFSTLVEDAEAYGEFMRSDAVGKHFDEIAISMLQASYDPLIDQTPMAWLYPILSFAVTGTFTDHHGKEMTPGAVATLGFDVIGKSVDFAKARLEATGRYTPGRSAMDYGGTDLVDDVVADLADSVRGKAEGGAMAGVAAVIDEQYAVADAAARGTDGTPTTSPAPSSGGPKKLSTGVKAGIGAVVVAATVTGGVFIASNTGGGDTSAATTSQPTTQTVQDPSPAGTGDDAAADATSEESEPDPGTGDPPPRIDEDDEPLDDELFEIPVPERDPGSLDAPAADGPTAQEMLLLPPPDPTTTDDEQRLGGGSLYVDATYVVDWQADIVVDNAVITPGYLFPPGSGWRGEFLILADCTGATCVYSTPLAHGDTMVFTQAGHTIYGTSKDLSGGCDRDIFIAFRVSDYQTINGRLVPDAIHGARIETGTCETPVYREIVYEGGFEFIGSYNDQ